MSFINSQKEHSSTRKSFILLWLSAGRTNPVISEVRTRRQKLTSSQAWILVNSQRCRASPRAPAPQSRSALNSHWTQWELRVLGTPQPQTSYLWLALCKKHHCEFVCSFYKHVVMSTCLVSSSVIPAPAKIRKKTQCIAALHMLWEPETFASGIRWRFIVNELKKLCVSFSSFEIDAHQ